MARRKRGRRDNGDGSFYQQANGLWVGAVTLPSGKRAKVSSKDRPTAWAKFQTLKQQAAANTLRAPSQETVESYLLFWVHDIKRPSLGPKSLADYNAFIAYYIVPHIGHLPMTRLRLDHLQTLMTNLEDQGLSASTLGMVHSILKQALEYAFLTERVPRNVMGLVTRKKQQRYTPTVLTLEQARQFLAAIEGHRHEVLFRLYLSLGLRRGEGLALQWSDITYGDTYGTLTISKSLGYISGQGLVLTTPKTERSRRTLRLPASLQQALRAQYLRQIEERLRAPDWTDTGYVFTTRKGTPYHPGNILSEFKQVLKQAGLPAIRLHDLRHSCATFLLAQGESLKVIQEILGHASIQTTSDVYAHLAVDASAHALDLLDAVLQERAV